MSYLIATTVYLAGFALAVSVATTTAVAPSASSSVSIMFLRRACNFNGKPCGACPVEWFEEGICYISPDYLIPRTFSIWDGSIQVDYYIGGDCGKINYAANKPTNTCFQDPNQGQVEYRLLNVSSRSAVAAGTNITLRMNRLACNASGSDVFSFPSGRCSKNAIRAHVGRYIVVEGFQDTNSSFIRYASFNTSDCSGPYWQRRYYRTDTCELDDGYHFAWRIGT